MRPRTHLALALAAAIAASVPGIAIAAPPEPVAPPAPVVAWQEHLDLMRAMHGNLGAHLVTTVIEQHGSLARTFGPSGAMVEMTGGMSR